MGCGWDIGVCVCCWWGREKCVGNCCPGNWFIPGTRKFAPGGGGNGGGATLDWLIVCEVGCWW